MLSPLLSCSTAWSLNNSFCFQAVEILKTAREITMRVRYFPYSKCPLAPQKADGIPAIPPELSGYDSKAVDGVKLTACRSERTLGFDLGTRMATKSNKQGLASAVHVENTEKGLATQC